MAWQQPGEHGWKAAEGILLSNPAMRPAPRPNPSGGRERAGTAERAAARRSADLISEGMPWRSEGGGSTIGGWPMRAVVVAAEWSSLWLLSGCLVPWSPHWRPAF